MGILLEVTVPRETNHRQLAVSIAIHLETNEGEAPLYKKEATFIQSSRDTLQI